MADQLALVLMVAAVVVLVATALVWLRPLLRPARTRVSDPAVGTVRSTSTAALAHGFGHLFSPLGLPRRQINLVGRLDRALDRIASVDPYANHRRIGLALLTPEPLLDPEPDNGLDAEIDPPPPAAAPATPWPFWAENEQREKPDD